MRYHKPTNSLILKLSDTERVTSNIPKARTVVHENIVYTQVKMGLDEMRVLRNIGINAPSPVRFEYNWPSRYPKPFEHQVTTTEFLTLNPKAICLNDMGCVDASTEYLSRTGWKRMDEYVAGSGDQVAQYHPDTGAIEFVEPTEYVKKPCPEMIRFKTSKGVDQLLSPEHRVLYVGSTGKTAVAQAHAIEARHEAATYGWKGRFITTFAPPERWGMPLSDDELRLQVAVAADGHVPCGTTRVIMRLKKQRKIDRLKGLLNATRTRSDWKYEEATGYTVVTFYAPTCDKEFGAAFWECTADQLRVVADECVHWDGSRRKAGAGDFFSTSKASADFIQYAFSATGRTASITVDVRAGRKDCYVVHARDNAALLYLCGTNAGVKSKTVWREPSPDGFKYCFMVPSTFLVLRRNGCVFATGNTGKTLSALWAADYLMGQGRMRKAIIVCPLSVMSVWANELHGHFMFKRTCAVLHGSKERRLKLLASDVDFYIINHEGLATIQTELAKRTDIDLWIVDEAAAYRNARTDRYAMLHGLVNNARWLWLFTGTPCPTSPTDAWALAKLLKNPKAPKYFNGFRDQVMHQITAYKWVPKEEAYDTAFQLLQPGIRFRKEDCIDLPPVTFIERECKLTAAQSKAYTEMHNELVASISGQTVTAANAAVKLSKLLQVCTGAVYDETGMTHTLDSSERMQTCLDIVDAAAHKVIVFVPFTAALHGLATYLRKHGHSVAVVDGSVSRAKRTAIFDAFQNEAEPRVLVAHPATTAHGLTLTRADTTIWYAPIFSLEVFDQANNRMNRPGQSNNMSVVMISATPMERQLYAALAGKARMQDAVLQLYKKELGMST